MNHIFSHSSQFSGHDIEENTITPLKSRINAILKFQPP